MHKNSKVIKAEKFNVTESMTKIKIDILEEYLPCVSIDGIILYVLVYILMLRIFAVALVGVIPREGVTKENDNPEQPSPSKKARTEKGKEELTSTLTQPVSASASAILQVSHEHKKLSLSVSSASTTYLPGGEASVDISVVDCDQKPVEGAEVHFIFHFIVRTTHVLTLVDRSHWWLWMKQC